MADRVRDMRGGFFWLNNVVFDQYLPKIGVIPYAVYSALTRHANNDTAQCCPSRARIAQYLSISTKSVDRAVKILDEAKMISVEHVKTGNSYSHNVYTLLEVHGVATNSRQGRDSESGGVGTLSPTNKTEIIKQKNKAVEWLASRYQEIFQRPQWRLTELRRKKGLLRLEESLKRTDGNMRHAVLRMFSAMKALRASEFHMGDNDRKTKYVEWETNLYGAEEKTEKWYGQWTEKTRSALPEADTPHTLDQLALMRMRRAAKNGR